MHTRSKTMLLGLVMLMVSCGTEVSISGPPPSVSPETARLADWLAGDFTTADNGKSLRIIRIWPDRKGTRWLYLEANESRGSSRTNKQIALQIGPGNDGDLAINVFEFATDRTPPAGADLEPGWFNRIDPMFLIARPGCTVHMLADGKSGFSGETSGEGCSDSRDGATHSTTSLTVNPEEIRIWERGWKADGSQAWGTTDGPIAFLRRNR